MKFTNKNLKSDSELPEGPNSFDGLDTYSVLSRGRIIFLSEEITSQSAADLTALLLFYNNSSIHQNYNDEIRIYINSEGGDLAGLISIYDVLRKLTCPIRTVCLGKAYSAAAVILAAGTSGLRFAMRHSQVMLHGIQTNFPLPNHDVNSSKSHYQFLKNNNDKLMEILSHHTGQELEKINKDCLSDLWMNSKEALQYGLIDRIL